MASLGFRSTSSCFGRRQSHGLGSRSVSSVRQTGVPVTCQLNVDNAPNRSAGQWYSLRGRHRIPHWDLRAGLPSGMMRECRWGIYVRRQEISERIGQADDGPAVRMPRRAGCAELAARAILLLCIATPSWTIFRTRAMWARLMEPRL